MVDDRIAKAINKNQGKAFKCNEYILLTLVNQKLTDFPGIAKKKEDDPGSGSSLSTLEKNNHTAIYFQPLWLCLLYDDVFF